MLKMVLLDTEKLPKQQTEELQQRLKLLGELTCYATTASNELVDRCKSADVILVNKNHVTEDHFKALPNLKYVIVIATGYDDVDVRAANKYAIKVSNIPGYSSKTVAQHTLALLLELTNQVGRVSQMVKNGKWYGTGHKHLELADLTLGVFGFGDIAQRVIKLAMALGMKVLVCSSKGSGASYNTDLAVSFVNRDDLFSGSDVISLHCPVTPETLNLINKDSLALMKSNCLLVNASRGALINEADLYAALSSKQISGAALDVTQVEPINLDNPLLTLDNCIFSPHNAWISDAALNRWLDIIEECVVTYQQNSFIHLV